EMVTDEERDFMYRAYAHDPRMRINLGIRRRLAPLLGNDRRLIELMNSLLMSMPGTPVLYYGDEIGMGDNIWLGDRNGVRTPMQWSADRNAGFSSANPQRLYLPVVIDPEYHYETINVESQQENSASLLWWMKRLIALRQRHHSVFGRGSIEFLNPDNHKVLAYVRRWSPPDSNDPGDEQTVLVVANLSRNAQAAQLPLDEFQGLSLVEMFGRTAFPPVTEVPYTLTLGPYQFYWFTLERAPSRLSLSNMREYAGSQSAESGPEAPEVTLSGEWHALLRGRGRERLEAILPAVLQRQRWFGGKARTVQAARIEDVAPVARNGSGAKKDDAELYLLVVRIEYADGEPERYVVPVAFAEGEEAGRLLAVAPTSVLATVRGRGQRGQSGVLYDALYDEHAGHLLLDTIARQRKYRTGTGELIGRRDVRLAKGSGDLPARVLRGEQSNTSVMFGDQYLMKVLRRLDAGESPDVEIGRYLSGRIEHVPDFLGTIDHRAKGSTATLAILQRFVPNEGDAWVYTLDELERFAERVLTDPPHQGSDLPSRASAYDLARSPLPESAHDVIGPFLDASCLLGRRTAELHAALAAGTDADFAPEPFSTLYQRSLYQSMRNALRRGLQQARKASGSLESDAARERIVSLAEREGEILEHLRGLSKTKIDAMRTRIHGDYHLGQVLWTGRDFVIIDFEGEPARPLGERRLKRSPLRDVAGMLRSFQYATDSALRFQVERGAVTPERPHHEELRGWLDYWHRWVSAGFLNGYLEAAEGSAFLPADPEHTRILLDAFLLEKAIYELGYELNNRPEWVDIPLRGIADVLGDIA
ncbi:MAG: putative maltokinase, partial [Egicoccus sp.]